MKKSVYFVRFNFRSVAGWAAGALMLLTATGFAKAGTIAAKAAICAACHGANGVPVSASIPNIWGQNEGYIYVELEDMKSGARANPQMAGLMPGLSKADIAALAAYFAAKPWPDLQQASASAADSKEAQQANDSIGCSGCHMDQFQGASVVPRLAGQNQTYLLAQMTNFRSGARANNPGMTSLMKATSPADLASLSKYVAGLPNPQLQN